MREVNWKLAAYCLYNLIKYSKKLNLTRRQKKKRAFHSAAEEKV